MPASEIFDNELRLRLDHFQSRDVLTAVEPFRPVVDGVIFKDQALSLFRDGSWQSHKEMILGTNKDETVFMQTAWDSRGRSMRLQFFEV